MQSTFKISEHNQWEYSVKNEEKSWDFNKVDTKYNNHGVHDYPAMMIPQIANRLIGIYGEDKDTILDPFSGTGTTLLEAKINSNFKTAYGIDINPLARLIAKVKTTPINPNLLNNSYNEIINEFNLKKDNGVEIDFFNINFWFKDYIIMDLAKLKDIIKNIENKDVKEFFLIVFSNIVRKVSNTRNKEFKLYKMTEKNLENFNPNVLDEFSKQSIKSIKKMKTFYKTYNDCKIKILNEDSRCKTQIPSNSVDLIVSSPPYGDSKTTVAYGQFSRLSLQWLDFDKNLISSIDKTSLGGKPVKDIENEILQTNELNNIITTIEKENVKRAREVLSFYIDFYKCIQEFDRILKDKSTLCFVVGNRTVKNNKIPTDKILVELFKHYNNNYHHERTIVRNIPNKRMPKKNSPTNIKGEKVSTMNHEYIVILNKDS
jgi:DNA modification methylase